MSNIASLFSFAGLLPGMPFGIRLDIEGTGNTGSHVVEDGISRIALTDTKTEPPYPAAHAAGSRHFLLLDGCMAGEPFPSPAMRFILRGGV